jgi:hypothetical protein
MGGVRQNFEHQTCELIRMAPHPRTLRKAREQVKYMVIDGSSAYRIRNYLHRWVMWWTNTSITWQYQELLQHFINASWHEQATAYATTLSCRQQLRLLHTGSADELGLAA